MSLAILLTDGEQRSTLAAVRSLGRSGHRAFVCSESGRSLAGASRHSAGEHQVASSLSHPRKFAQDIARICSEHDIGMLLPMTEQAFNAVFANPDLCGGLRIPAAAPEKFRAISDKQRVLDAASARGLAVPRQVVLRNPRDAEHLDQSTLQFPLVLKPSRSVAASDDRQLKLGVVHCRDSEALTAELTKLPATAYPLLLQQRIVGPGVGVFLLMWDGEVIATFSHRRIREKPPAGGVSVYRESVLADPTLVEKSRQLLDHFEWQGVAMVEFKLDEATGTPYIMEINGRFWGSLQLAIDAGVDFPSLLIARALGQNASAAPDYKIGIRSKWEWGEVDHFLARLRRNDKELSLPPGFPGRLSSVLRLLVPWRPGDRFEVLRLSDPAPFLRESAQYFRRS